MLSVLLVQANTIAVILLLHIFFHSMWWIPCKRFINTKCMKWSLFLMMGEIVLFIAENLFYANIGRSAKMHWKEEFCVNLAIVIIFIGQMSSVERKKREKSFFHNKKLTASPCGPLCSTEGNEITWYPFHQQRFVYSLHFYFKHLCIYPVNYTCQ